MSIIERALTHFSFDPQRDGYTSGNILSTIAGTPSISSGKLLLNSARVVGTQALRMPGSIEFTLTIPTAPTAGHSRFWGISLPYLSTRGKIGFSVSGAVISCVVYGDDGVAMFSQPITWNGSWTATPARFRIDVGEAGVKFFVNESLVTGADGISSFIASSASAMPTLPVSIDLENQVADNMTCSGFVARSIANVA